MIFHIAWSSQCNLLSRSGFEKAKEETPLIIYLVHRAFNARTRRAHLAPLERVVVSKSVHRFITPVMHKEPMLLKSEFMYLLIPFSSANKMFTFLLISLMTFSLLGK